MKTLITRIKRLALALCFVTPLVSWADAITAVNPVTGETETYTYKFIGTDTWDGTEYWQDSDGNNPSAVPAKSGDNTWEPILFDGNTININASMSVEGWNLRMGLYNGANVTMNNFVKWQGDTDMWVTVDGTSKFTVGAFGKGNIADGKVIKCSTTRANGIEWLVNLESTGNANNTFEYYLAGEGSVSYQGVTAANHKIKQADVALSGNEKSVQSKTLVSFTSTDKTFTADAAIKVKNGDNVLKTVYLTSVTAGEGTTLTTDSDVGACELVQTSTGIVLYYVDGDPADVPVEEKTYKPSININFTNGAGNGLTTQADVGLSGYEVPGTSWNNYVVANSTFSTVNAIDSTGAASAMSGVSVTISKTRGSWSCSGLVASSNPLHGYIDEEAGANSTPTVTVTGIPYYKYRVLVYHSTDSANVPFGYDTINGTDYTYENDALAEGTTAWGNSGAKDSANAIAEGGNVLVTEALSGSTLTVVGHRAGGDSSARGCIAAIQIIEVKADVGENDLEIAVDGETEYTVTAEDAEKTGTVYLTGSGTLTLAGENKISAATIEISGGVTLVVNADRLDATTFTGAGTVVYNNALPVTGKGWTDSAWTGTVWINGKSGVTDFNVNSYGNANSAVKLSGVDGWISAPFDNTVPVVLENGTFDYALKLTNGNSPNNQYPTRCTTFVKVSGNGTISDGGSANPMLKIYDGTEFTGALTLTRARVVFCAADSTTLPDAYNTGIPAASIYVDSGNSATVASGKTWTADGGFVVNGTLNANGTLASSLATKAVSGTGTVVFGGVPSPTGNAWWKNAAWTGTVEIKGVTALNGDYAFSDYGNAGSTVKLTNCSGWLKNNYTCVPALEIGGTFTWNDGASGLNNTFKVATLKGSGTISIPNRGAETAVWQITDDWSQFTGVVVGNNDGARRVLVFGSTLPTSITKGEIYVSEGATLDLDNASGAWWGVGMGFVVDGTVKASARNKWGGGTAMTLGDTGVLEFVSTANTDDQNTGMGNITGTGTLKFSSSAGWRSFPKVDANMPATTLTIQTELDDSLIVPTKNDGETVIGNLAGSKNVRSDWSNNGENGRILTVTQSKNTEWQGKFVSNRITQFNVVAPTEGTPGTLTLSGAQEATIPMQVDGSVNLTGTWVGATTVAGTIGGTGTLTGDLTLTDGATFKAAATALTVSGTVTLPTEEGETLTIDASAIDADEVTIISSESITAETDVSKVAVNGLYTVTPVAGALKLVTTKVEVTVPAIANTTVTVAVGGETIGTEAGSYKVAPDSVVTVTYAAAAGYEISGTTEYTIDTSKSETTFDPAETTVKQYVAYVVFQQEQGEAFVDVTNYYLTVWAAIDAAKTLKKTVVLIAQPYEGDTYEIAAGETINIKKGEFTFEGIIFPEGAEYNNTTTEIAGVTQYKCAINTATITYPGQEPEGSTLAVMQILGGLYSGYMPSYAGTVVTVLDGSDATIGDAMPEVFTYNAEAHTYTLKTMVASYNNGYTTTYYPSLANAVATVAAGSTITLVADDTVSFANVEVESGVPSNGSIVIDKNLTIDGANFTVYGNTNADILNATGSATPGYDMVADLADGSNLLGFFVKSGNVTFTNITLTEFGDTAYVNKFGYTPIQTASAYTGTLTLTGVNFSKFNRTAVCVRGGTLAMTGGTIAGGTVNKNNGDYFQQPVEVRGGTATISGVTITGGNDIPGNGGGAIVAWANTTVNNVNINFTGVGIWSDGAVVTVTGESTTVSATTALYSEEDGDIRISVGTFTGALTGCETDTSTTPGTISITGGTFSVDPSDYVAEGYAATESAGVWTVGPYVPPMVPHIEPGSSVLTTTFTGDPAWTDDQVWAEVLLQPPTGVTVDNATYKSYFTYTVERNESEFTVTITGIQPAVTTAVETSAIAALQGNGEVAVLAGLYYGFAADDVLGTLEPAAYTLATEDGTMTIDKTAIAEGATAAFVRVVVSPSPKAQD